LGGSKIYKAKLSLPAAGLLGEGGRDGVGLLSVHDSHLLRRIHGSHSTHRDHGSSGRNRGHVGHRHLLRRVGGRVLSLLLDMYGLWVRLRTTKLLHIIQVNVSLSGNDALDELDGEDQIDNIEDEREATEDNEDDTEGNTNTVHVMSDGGCRGSDGDDGERHEDEHYCDADSGESGELFRWNG
jgi:hypothetical protein